MELIPASNMARALMAQYLTIEWRFEWDHSKSRAGRCSYKTKTITMSRALTEVSDEAEVRETMLHEIAHALVGPGHGHDLTWRVQAMKLGSTGKRTHSLPVEYRWHSLCWCGEGKYKRNRLTNNLRYYSRCPRCKQHLTWIDTALVKV